jgi:hypothetical protein
MGVEELVILLHLLPRQTLIQCKVTAARDLVLVLAGMPVVVVAALVV